MVEKNEQGVFETLFHLDVNDRVEKKKSGNTQLSYLSWAFAWAEVKKRFPNTHYEILKFENNQPYVFDEKTGYMVFTKVTIDGITHEMWLPVMDGANKAMKNEPYTYMTKYNGEKTCDAATMFDVNKTIMRCLVKNLAMFGLGLYIYSGEDLPESEPPKPATTIQIKALTKEIERMAELAGIAYEKAEKGILTHLKLNKKLKDITNEEYGTMLGYINKMIPVYEKKAADKKAAEQAAHQDAQVEQVGMEMQYNIPEK